MSKLIYSIISIPHGVDELSAFISKIKGIEGAELGFVQFEEVAAVTVEYHLDKLVVDKETAIDYAGVIEALAAQYVLLPVRFGSIMDSEVRIFNMLKNSYLEIQKNLNLVANKFEFGLKIFCDSSKLKAELSEIAVTKVSASVSGSENPGTSVFRDYVNKKLEIHRSEEMLLTYVEVLISNIRDSCESHSTVCKIRKMVSETKLLDSFFLVEKENTENFLSGVKEIQSQYPGLNFIVTGPWPPYSFVEINLM
ncbi:MAG: GvpL/GvpF family gas vesicle protein [Bacteroidota bacterium]